MPCFTSLPDELIQHVLGFLAAEEPPSKRFLHEEPSLSSLHSTHHPLKELVQTCRLLHRLSWLYLFSCLKSDIKDTNELVTFTNKYRLRGSVQSLVLYSTEVRDEDRGHSLPLSEAQPASTSFGAASTSIWSRVVVTMDAIDPLAVSFMLPPAEFESILPYQLDLENAWAFNIPYQILRLEQQPDMVRENLEAKALPSYKIFSLRPWSHMTFNEGSSVQAYSTYEYFHKHAPSLLYPKNALDPIYPYDVFSRLSSLDYIAVFPIGSTYRSFVLPMNMRNLHSLRIRFSPTPANNVLDNSQLLGKCQRSDLWSELLQNYCYFTNISLLWNRLEGLKEFTIMDYPNHKIHEMLHNFISVISNEVDGWHSEGEGHWIRDD